MSVGGAISTRGWDRRWASYDAKTQLRIPREKEDAYKESTYAHVEELWQTATEAACTWCDVVQQVEVIDED